jgi:hypothetical protein
MPVGPRDQAFRTSIKELKVLLDKLAGKSQLLDDMQLVFEKHRIDLLALHVDLLLNKL